MARTAPVPTSVAGTGKLNIGREQFGDGRWYFDGEIADVTVTDAVLTGKVSGKPEKPETFNGKTTWREASAPKISQSVSVAAWIKIANVSAEANYIASMGEWNQAFSLGLFAFPPDLDLGQRSNAAYVALNFIWYWQYTRDMEFLGRSAYPYLREVAAFWEDYLKFENGRYIIYNDSIHEGSGNDVNPILTLGLLRTLFGNVLPMSMELGVDSEKRAKWRDILGKLSDFPLQERGGRTVFRYAEKGTAWWNDNTLGIQHIFPSGAIGLESDPETAWDLPQHDRCHGTLGGLQWLFLMVHGLCADRI